MLTLQRQFLPFVAMLTLALMLESCNSFPAPAVISSPASAVLPSASTPFPADLDSTGAQPASTQLLPTKRTPQVLRRTPVASSAAVVGSLSLGKQDISGITLDDTHIYWSSAANPRILSRYPLSGQGDVETVATSRYPDGDLPFNPAIRSNDWLIYLDTPLSAQGITWAIRALNLKTGEEQIVAEDPHDPTSWPGPFLDADGDWVVWTRLQRSVAKDCAETVLTVYNLKTGEPRELDRHCADNDSMWVMPHMSDDHIVVERDLSDSKGGGSDIHLFDLASGQARALTDNGRSSMPDISGRWVVWKDGPRFKEGRTVVYDMESGDEKIIAASHLDPHVANGRWVYWLMSAKEPLRVYDLKTDRLLTVAEPGGNENLQSVAVYDDTIAWYRNLDFEHAPSDGMLEWCSLIPGALADAQSPTLTVAGEPPTPATEAVTATTAAVFSTDGWVEHRLKEAGAQVSLPPDWTPMRLDLAGYFVRPTWVQREIDPAAFALLIGIQGDVPYDLPGLTETQAYRLSENEPGPLTHEPITLAGHEGVAFWGFAYGCMQAFVPADGVVHAVRVSSYLCQGEGSHR